MPTETKPSYTSVRISAGADDAARREIVAVLADIDAHPWPTEIVPARVLYDQLGPPLAADIRDERFEIGGMPAQRLTPPVSDPDRAVLFLHGGGYVYGSLASHAGMVAEVARAARCPAIAIQYRLAPEHPFPAALEDACAAYEWLLRQNIAPEKIAIIGDSAGGGLVMSTLVSLRDRGRPLPGATVCISPWVDLESKGESWTSRQAIDPMLTKALVDELSVYYLKDKPRSFPAVSTVNADLRGLPPMLIQVGEREVLFSEAELLGRRAHEAGIPVEFEEWAEMVHVWHLYFHMLGKGRDAIRRVGEFVLGKTAATAAAAGTR